MSTTTVSPPLGSLVVWLGPEGERISDDEFFAFCQRNRHLRIEQSSQGEVILMPPAGGESSHQEFELAGLFHAWAKADGRGIGFSSSAGFRLPNGATRSPDLAWVERSRWDALTPAERRKFPPLCPDFVVEIRSPSDNLAELQAKMEEYRANGAQLGWLIDPEARRVYVYRPGAEVVVRDGPDVISGDPLLPGFTLELRRIWGE